MDKPKYKTTITVLGSGTSSGVPTVGCSCRVCTSKDPRDKRLRSSILVQRGDTNVVIDTSPDFRQQMLTYDIKHVEAIVFTHSHFDHIGGFDDIRAFNYHTRKPMPIYVNDETLAKLKRTFYYAFEIPEQLGGGVPMIDVNMIGSSPFSIGDIEFCPILIKHGKLDVLGFRIGDFAYCTDTNNIPPEAIDQLKGIRYLIVDALRYHRHPTHFSLDESIEIAREIGAPNTWFTHMAHEILHAECEETLPPGMKLATDGLVIEF